ncbi:MAG: hybrid sensor histidine kinase/response regulator, partial [Proteobacteria bacterium]
LVVVRSGTGKFIAVAVDSVSEECEALIKDLGPAFRSQKLFSGGVLQGNGNVALVLDPQALFTDGKLSRSYGHVTVQAATAKEAPKKSDIRILVVDDSITTRTLERSILEASGFSVTLAVDGLDALEKLKVGEFDLVISDIEMPRMDGFGLLGELKKSEKFSRLPVIMVSSLEKPEHKERGLKLGAEAYVLKQKFDQGSLLETIEQILGVQS